MRAARDRSSCIGAWCGSFAPDKQVVRRPQRRDVRQCRPMLAQMQRFQPLPQAGQVLWRQMHAVMPKPGRPKRAAQPAVARHARPPLRAGDVEIHHAQKSTGFKHGDCVIDRPLPVRDHRQCVGKIRAIHRFGWPVGGCVGLGYHDVRLACITRLRDDQQRPAQVDHLDACEGSQARAEEFQVAAGSTAKFDDALAGLNGEQANDIFAPLQQTFTEVAVASGLRPIEIRNASKSR